MSTIQASEDVFLWLQSKLDKIQVPSDDRFRIAVGCFDMAMEHQISITLLVKNKLYGSAFSLARCVFESYVKGIWFKNCANEKNVDHFINEKFNYTFQALIDDIELLEAYSEGVLSEGKKAGWKILNEFTHSGIQQIGRRNTDESAESSYSDEDISILLNFANSLSLMCGLEVACLSQVGKDVLKKEFVEKIKDYHTNLS